MDPITIGLMAGGGGLGLLQGQNNERKMYQDAMMKANLAQYAPWSDLAKGVAAQPGKDLQGQDAALFQGAATGASMGNLFAKQAAAKTGTEVAAGSPGAMSSPGQNALGGQTMANQLGEEYGMQAFNFQPRYMAIK